jgi:hypothetical protein
LFVLFYGCEASAAQIKDVPHFFLCCYTHVIEAGKQRLSIHNPAENVPVCFSSVGWLFALGVISIWTNFEQAALFEM